MGGELYLRIPGLGFIAMFDMVAYAVAIPVIGMYWGEMGKYMRMSLKWAFAWTFAAMVANAFNFYDAKFWLKCVVVIGSSWALLSASYVLLKKSPMAFMWYIVGAGIGGWIGLYHFRNGALEAFATQGDFGAEGLGVDLLLEKQIYPQLARGIMLGCVLPIFLWWRKFPVFGIIIATFATGFWVLVHGGSRSSFGVFCAAALVGGAVAYGKKIYRKIGRRPFLMVMLGCLALATVFGGYKIMAVSGSMGEAEKRKYEKQFSEGSGAIEGRTGVDNALYCVKESFGIGRGKMLRAHSVIMNSLACEGIVGFCFWVFFYMQIFWFMGRRMPYAGSYSTFISYLFVLACWNVFGSPFGARHQFFVPMAFIAMCRDDKFFGAGTVFDYSLTSARE
ncbi:MAG: hypothetical protein J6T01_00330 [Kiritimatiellae bacterium]|nr:hypothetical protein [Kiritimatiellia bacterium]